MTIDFDSLGLEILAEVSKTNMSEVYRARQVSIDRIVCLKLATSTASATTLQRFQREAQIMTSLQHPHIANTYQFGIVNGLPYLLLEWLDGEPLSALLARGPLSSEQVCQFFAELASAIQFAHTQGIIHRDLKPSNVFLHSQGSETIVKVIDFGISKQESSDNPESGKLTQTCAILGSPAYISPEQSSSQPATAASDQYALACVLYEMLTGKRVFEANSDFELLLCHAQQTPVLARLKDVLLKALQKNPNDRFLSVSDFWNAAEPLVAKNDVPQKTSKSAILILLAVIIVTAGTLAGWQYHRRQQTKAEQQSLTNQTPVWTDKTFDNLEADLNKMIANSEFVGARKKVEEAFDTSAKKARLSPRQQITLSCIFLRTYFMNSAQRRKLPVVDQKACEPYVESIHALLGKEERYTRTNALMDLGQWRFYNGDLAGAEKYFRQAICENEKHIGAQHERYWNDRATYRRCLAEVLEERRLYPEALQQRLLLQQDKAKGAPELWYMKPIAKLELACDLYRTGEKRKADELVSTVENEYALPKPEIWTAEAVQKKLTLNQYFDTYYQLSDRADLRQKLFEEQQLLDKWQTAHH